MNKGLKCQCGYTGDFSEVNVVLCHSAVTVQLANDDGIKTGKMLSMFVCPKCGVVQIPTLPKQFPVA